MPSRGNSRTRRRAFAAEGLEPRRLLAYAYVNIGTALQGTEYDHTSPITILPGQPVTFDVQVQGSSPDGTGVTIPTGSVKIYWQQDTGGQTVATVPLTGGTLANSIANVYVTATLSLNQYAAAGQVDSNGVQRNFVYAEYLGDSNYADTSSTAGLTEPSPNGNVVTVNFAPTHFAFSQQPSDAPANSAITPPLTVSLLDAGGAVDPYYNSETSLAIATGPTGGSLVPPTSSTSGETFGRSDSTYLVVNDVNGVGTFPDVELSTAGAYTLSAGAQTYFGGATSNTFNVIAGSKLAFGQAPSDGTAKKPLAPPVTVKIENADGSVKTDDNSTVVTLATVGVTGDAAITGNTATAVNGVATFADLTLTTPGFYQLQATDSAADASVTSAKFKVAGDQLVFLSQPKDTDVNTPVPLGVKIVDPDGNLVTDATSSVVLSLNTVSGGTNAALSGTTTAAFVGGIATFSKAAGPMINAAGTYTLTATEEDTATGALAPTNTTSAITTGTFGIAGLHLRIVKQPRDADVLKPVPFAVQVVDNKGKLDKTETGTVQLTLNTVTGGDGATLAGTTTATLVNGVATFTATAGPTINGVGTYTFTAALTGSANPATSIDSKPFKVLGYKLQNVDKSMTTVALHDDLQPGIDFAQVTLVDPQGKPVSYDTGLPSVQLSLKAISRTGTLEGVTTFNAASLQQPTGQGTNVDLNAYYQILINVSEPGTYDLTIAPVDGTNDSVDASAIEPTTVRVKVVDPVLMVHQELPKIANLPTTLYAYLADPHDKRTELATRPAFGYELTLTPQKDVVANLTSDTGTSLGNHTVAVAFGTSPDTNPPQVTIDSPGRFTVAALEVTSGGDAAFDASGVTPVTYRSALTTKPFTVLPDHLKILTAPPTHLSVGQTFSMSVAITDKNGNVLTDVAQDDPLGPSVTLGLTFISKNGANALAGVTTVPIVNGVATFDNVSFAAAGYFAIRAREQNNYDEAGLYYDPLQPIIATSKLIKVAP